MVMLEILERGEGSEIKVLSSLPVLPGARTSTELLSSHQLSTARVSTHLRIAGSMMSGLLVAPMMKTFFLLPIPSISVRIWLMTLSEAPPASPLVPPLDLAILSNSSKNRTQGEADLNVRIFQC